MSEKDCRRLRAEIEYLRIFDKIKASIDCTEFNNDKDLLFMNLYQCMLKLLDTIHDKKAKDKLKKKLNKLYDKGITIIHKELIEKFEKNDERNTF